MKWIHLTTACLLTISLTSCSNGDDTNSKPEKEAKSSSATGGDCAREVQFDNRSYSEYGTTELAGAELGSGELAPCNDSSNESSSSQQKSESVRVFRIPEVRPAEVIAMEVDQGSYSVLLDEGLDDTRRAELVEILGLEN